MKLHCMLPLVAILLPLSCCLSGCFGLRSPAKMSCVQKEFAIEVGEFNDAGQRVGTWYQFHADSTLIERMQYRAGKLHGVSIRYGSGGTPFLRIRYRNGEKDGWQRSYNSKQQCMTAILFDKGVSLRSRIINPKTF